MSSGEYPYTESPNAIPATDRSHTNPMTTSQSSAESHAADGLNPTIIADSGPLEPVTHDKDQDQDSTPNIHDGVESFANIESPKSSTPTQSSANDGNAANDLNRLNSTNSVPLGPMMYNKDQDQASTPTIYDGIEPYASIESPKNLLTTPVERHDSISTI